MTTQLTHSHRKGLIYAALVAVLFLMVSTFSAAQNTVSPNQVTVFDAFLQSGHCVPEDPASPYGRPADGDTHTLTILGANFLKSGYGRSSTSVAWGRWPPWAFRRIRRLMLP